MFGGLYDALLIDGVKPRQFRPKATIDVFQHRASSYAYKGGSIAVASMFSSSDFGFDGNPRPLRFRMIATAELNGDARMQKMKPKGQ